MEISLRKKTVRAAILVVLTIGVGAVGYQKFGHSSDKKILITDLGQPIQLSFGSFGTCDLDVKASVIAGYCDRDHLSQDEGIILNYYLQTVWDQKTFSASSIAKDILEHTQQSDNIYWTSEVPDPITRDPVFSIFSGAVVPVKDFGQLQMGVTKTIHHGVINITFSKIFHGPRGQLEQRMKAWMVENAPEVSRELKRLQPSDDVVATLVGLHRTWLERHKNNP
jgi:hypothetical protein